MALRSTTLTVEPREKVQDLLHGMRDGPFFGIEVFAEINLELLSHVFHDDVGVAQVPSVDGGPGRGVLGPTPPHSAVNDVVNVGHSDGKKGTSMDNTF